MNYLEFVDNKHNSIELNLPTIYLKCDIKFTIQCYADIQPPTFTKCPSVVYGYTARNLLEGEVVWEYPIASDNYDTDINVTWTGPISPNDKIKAGTYTIIYNAEDSTGNQAIPCITKIVMKGKVK